jgi:peptidoglycan/xylan/chitin deacetylase (PgdA/CDA1 family)
MNKLARRIAVASISRLAAPRIVQKFSSRHEFAIVMYHGVVHAPLRVPDWCFLDEQTFVKQIRYLDKHFAVLPLADAVAQSRTTGFSKPTAVITFDDGFQNNYELAYPILKALGVPAVVFLVTGLVGTDGTLWFCRLHRALAETKLLKFHWAARTYDLSTVAARATASAALQAHLKELSATVLKAELVDILRSLGDDMTRAEPPDSPFRILSGDSIRVMARSGLIEFGAHTESHTILSRLSDVEAEKEIRDSFDRVSDLAERDCRLFAYPNGRRTDYGASAVATLRQIGTCAAVTTISGPNDRSTPQLELRRYGIGADMTFDEFRITVHHLGHKLRNAIR